MFSRWCGVGTQIVTLSFRVENETSRASLCGFIFRPMGVSDQAVEYLSIAWSPATILISATGAMDQESQSLRFETTYDMSEEFAAAEGRAGSDVQSTG